MKLNVWLIEANETEIKVSGSAILANSIPVTIPRRNIAGIEFAESYGPMGWRRCVVDLIDFPTNPNPSPNAFAASSQQAEALDADGEASFTDDNPAPRMGH